MFLIFKLRSHFIVGPTLQIDGTMFQTSDLTSAADFFFEGGIFDKNYYEIYQKLNLLIKEKGKQGCLGNCLIGRFKHPNQFNLVYQN